MNTVLIVVIVLVVCALSMMRKYEGYSSLNNVADDYYSWRAYGHNVYDKKRLLRYPYNYKRYPYNSPFKCYSTDLDYNYPLY